MGSEPWSVELSASTEGFLEWPGGGSTGDLAAVFDQRAALSATFSGSDRFPELSLAARGVGPLAGADVVGRLGMLPGRELELHWEAGPGAGACVELLVTGDDWDWDDNPAYPLTLLQCRVPDEGRLVVPAAITAQFPSSAFPEPDLVCAEVCPEPAKLCRVSRDLISLSTGLAELHLAGEPLEFHVFEGISNPAGVSSEAGWQEVTVGDGFACGRREDGSVVCWGLDSAGQSSPP